MNVEIDEGQALMVESNAAVNLAIRVGDNVVGDKKTTKLSGDVYGGMIASGKLPSGLVAVANFSKEDVYVRVR